MTVCTNCRDSHVSRLHILKHPNHTRAISQQQHYTVVPTNHWCLTGSFSIRFFSRRRVTGKQLLQTDSSPGLGPKGISFYHVKLIELRRTESTKLSFLAGICRARWRSRPQRFLVTNNRQLRQCSSYEFSCKARLVPKTVPLVITFNTP